MVRGITLRATTLLGDLGGVGWPSGSGEALLGWGEGPLVV